MNASPLVTVAIPAYNPQFFRVALQSVLAQSYDALEVVVVDDSAGEQIQAIVEELQQVSRFNIGYWRNPQRLGFARNLLRCLELAQGDFIKFLCDDDQLLSESINLQAQALATCPDVHMAIAQRLLCDSQDYLLPPRMETTIISPGSSVLNGGDLLEILELSAPELFGGVSHSLLRRSAVEEFLPALVQEGQGFTAKLVPALYVCLLRRGHLASLQEVLAVERLHPARLSHQASMQLAAQAEGQWLVQMIAARGSEPAPAKGWVRYAPLDAEDGSGERVWDEFELGRFISGQAANYKQEVGSSSQNFAELYQEWLDCRQLSATQLKLLPKRLEGWPRQPSVVPVIIDDEPGQGAMADTLRSLAAQSFPAGHVLVLSRHPQPQSLAPGILWLPLAAQPFAQINDLLATELAAADWLFLLQAGDHLHPDALLIMAERAVFRPDMLCWYCDEGRLVAGEPSDPIFKPDFNLDMMRSFPYVGRLLGFSRAGLLEHGGFDLRHAALAPHDLLWRMVEGRGTHTVEHIAELLVQTPQTSTLWLAEAQVVAQAPALLQAHLERTGVQATVSNDGQSATCRIHYEHPQAPLVSIVIYGAADVHAIHACTESLLDKTAYFNYEILLLTCAQSAPDIAAWATAMVELGAGKIRCVELDPGMVEAAALNQACDQARGEYVLLLQGNSLILEKHWLDELVNHAQRPEVGVVGGKVCSKNATILQAGLVLGLRGPASSPFVGQSIHADGYMQRLGIAHNCSAVSAQCLMVRRELFQSVEGFDALAFAHSLYDVDLCLRIRHNGYVVVWTPFALVAQIAPRQSLPSRLATQANAQDEKRFFQRWLAELANDPAYNQNLSLKMASFNLNPGLRVGWDPFIARTLPSVLALPVNTSAVGHYRVAQPFLELEMAGWIQGRVNYATPPLVELEREKPDVIILQCRYMNSSLREIERIKRHSGAMRIYELDDYIIDVPSKNAHSRNMPKDMRSLVQRGIAMCDRVVVSTQPLADALSSMHHDIRVVPNMLASQLWHGLHGRRQTSAKPRVGWGGGTSHRGDLELIADVVRILADEVDWVFFGMCPDLLKPYIKEFHAGVSLQAYPAKLASLNLDLAVAPLEHNLFNDCKSNLRLLEFGACGFPVVCSDTKAYAGYLPCTRVANNTTEQWLAAIRMHLDDPQASYRMGDQLRETVLRDYVLTADNLQQWVNGWLAD